MNTNIANIIFQHFDRNILDNIYLVRRHEYHFGKQFYILAYSEEELYAKLWNDLDKDEKSHFLLRINYLDRKDLIEEERDIGKFTSLRYIGQSNLDEYDGVEVLEKYFATKDFTGAVIEKINVH